MTQKPSSVVPGRPLGLKEQKVLSGVGVRYLYQPGELEGGRQRATDPVWSLEEYRLGRSVTKPDEPVLYYLQGDDAPQRSFVRESCWRCYPTHSYLRMGSSGVEQLFNPPRNIPQGPHPCVHMPACPSHFFRSSAWNQRVRETPCSDVALRCDGALTARHPCHGGMFAFRRGPLCTARF